MFLEKINKTDEPDYSRETKIKIRKKKVDRSTDMEEIKKNYKRLYIYFDNKFGELEEMDDFLVKDKVSNLI